MDVPEAVQRVLQGESLRQIHDAYRKELLAALGMDPEEAPGELFADEASRFLRKLCRELGDRHGEDPRVMVALQDWAQQTQDYEAWDALLSNFDFPGKQRWIERGRRMFPGPLTAHWSS